MTAVLSPTSSSPSSSPRPPQSSSPNPSIQSLPPLVTSNPRTGNTPQRQSSYAKARMSTYSQTSNASQRVSRPSSMLMPIVRSSLPYTQVRDFAYAPTDPLHFGPLPISAPPSGQSTPAFESQLRLGDIPTMVADQARPTWSAAAFSGGGGGGHEQLPQVAYSAGPDDHGPPYSEDEDLQSPVVVTSRHRRWPPGADEKSPDYEGERSYFAGVNGDGSETYYVGEVDEMADGPGGELVTYPSDHARHSSALYPNYQDSRLNPGNFHTDESRYSREYQFTIASPDEEMHGKAVALFDFARENENELPLVEGQVIWVSYRHGQGWLVAEDPRTQESGLVPEEYVRLLRDIEGGWSSLNENVMPQEQTSNEEPVETTDTESVKDTKPGHQATGSTGSNGEKRAPTVSTFSTSSKDLDHYPHPDLGTQTGQPPPQVVHYSSQSNTPTVRSPSVGKKGESSEKDKKDKKGKDVKRSVSKQSRKENRR